MVGAVLHIAGQRGLAYQSNDEAETSQDELTSHLLGAVQLRLGPDRAGLCRLEVWGPEPRPTPDR